MQKKEILTLFISLPEHELINFPPNQFINTFIDLLVQGSIKGIQGYFLLGDVLLALDPFIESLPIKFIDCDTRSLVITIKSLHEDATNGLLCFSVSVVAFALTRRYMVPLVDTYFYKHPLRAHYLFHRNTIVQFFRLLLSKKMRTSKGEKTCQQILVEFSSAIATSWSSGDATFHDLAEVIRSVSSYGFANANFIGALLKMV